MDSDEAREVIATEMKWTKDSGTHLYCAAIRFGRASASLERSTPAVDWPLYWAAWFAARRVCFAMLSEAHEMGLSYEQIERLRALASRIAPD